MKISRELNLGWSGHTDTKKEFSTNRKILLRTNRVLKKLGIASPVSAPITTFNLSFICDAEHSGLVTQIAEHFRYNFDEPVADSAAEIIAEIGGVQ